MSDVHCNAGVMNADVRIQRDNLWLRLQSAEDERVGLGVSPDSHPLDLSNMCYSGHQLAREIGRPRTNQRQTINSDLQLCDKNLGRHQNMNM